MAVLRGPVPLDVRLMNAVSLGLWFLLGVGGLLSLVWWGAHHPAWGLAKIVVDGDIEHQNTVAFRAQLLPQLRGSFLTIDVQEVQALFEQMPWVKQAVVRREFPNRLRVTLREHEAVAWWGGPDTGRLLNRDGDVFEAEVEDAPDHAWPQLFGPPERSHEVYALYLRLQALLAPLGSELKRLEMGPSGHWTAQLAQGLLLEIGRGEPDELLARVQRFVQTVPQLSARYERRGLESVDLRYPNGYAVRMRGVQTVTDDKAADALALRLRQKQKQSRHSNGQ